MSKMIEVKVAELIGPALDWAVAQAVGQPIVVVPWAGMSDASTGHKMKYHWHRVLVDADVDREEWTPTCDWSQGGPLIDRYDIMFDVKSFALPPHNRLIAYRRGKPELAKVGHHRLVAACRAIVAAKLGDVVSVPAELVESKA